MLENPVDESPGVGNCFYLSGTAVNFRWLRYLYMAHRILHLKFSNSFSTWVDVGSYYGGVQGIVKKYRPDVRMVLVDFNHQLCRSFIYLKKIFPDCKHVFPNQLTSDFDWNSVGPGTIVYVPVDRYDCLDGLKTDLFTNFFSFGEMPENVMASYLKSKVYKNALKKYLVNRVVSSPFYEATYENKTNIFNYQLGESKIEHFDLFPIHQYQIANRLLFKRKAPRNYSSPYFECIFK